MVTRKGTGAAALALCLGLGGMVVLSSAQSAAAAKGKPKPAAKSQPKAAAALAPAANGRICVEAESGKITSQVVLFKDPECSGGAGIEVPENVNHDPKTGEVFPKVSGESVISLNVGQEGTYQLWARCWWADGCGNSFLVSVDGGERTTVSGGNYKRWYWVRGPRIRLSAGKHTLAVHNSEDGARMDQLFLTSDFGRIPVGKMKPTQ